MASNFFDQFDTSTAKPEGGGNFFDQFDPASAKPEPDPGFVARLGQGASRALDSAKTALTDDPKKIAKIAADQARTALPTVGRRVQAVCGRCQQGGGLC